MRKEITNVGFEPNLFKCRYTLYSKKGQYWVLGQFTKTSLSKVHCMFTFFVQIKRCLVLKPYK